MSRCLSPLVLFATLILLSSCSTMTIRRSRATRSYVKNLTSEFKDVIEIGPLLGHAGPGYLTLSCRTNEDSRLTVHIGGKKYISDGEEYHRVTVGGLPEKASHSYTVEVQELEGEKRHETFGPYSVNAFPRTAPFRFVAYGDPQAVGKIWGPCSERMSAEHPSFALGLGDLVWTGPDKWEWRDGYFAPARKFLSTVPQLVVKGNHDIGGEKWFHLFATPSGTGNWTQVIGPLRLVGVDITSSWDPEEPPYQWLDGVLASAREPYLFLAVHVPPYTSTMHGDMGDRSAEHSLSRISRSVFLPLMERYKGTAILSGHAHAYERSESPEGLTCITAGGAGAHLYRRSIRAALGNPWSHCFVMTHHYLVFDVDEQACVMKAVDLEGKVLDVKRWLPRVIP